MNIFLEALSRYSEKSILFNSIAEGKHHWGHFQQMETLHLPQGYTTA